MSTPAKICTILMADDDAEDHLLVRDALRETGLNHDLRVVSDGEELLDYLHGRAKYRTLPDLPRPDLVLLDLNMPKKDGREVLQEIKADGAWQRIPIVVLTTSTADDDVGFSYDMGASSYITKPVTFRAWVDLVRVLSKYWFELVKLPPES